MAESMRVTLVGPTGADVSGALRQLSGPETSRLCYSVVRLGVTRIKARAFAKFRAGGIGKAIWGSDKAKPGNVVKSKVVKKDHDGFEIAFALKGLPAMTEEGGQTKAHPIAPKLSGALAFTTKSGVLVVTEKAILHPGGPIRRDPFLQPAIDVEAPRISADLERAMDGYVAKAADKKV